MQGGEPGSGGRRGLAAVEAQQRAREWFHALTVPPGMWSIIRVDGRGFSRFTAEAFDKPFDQRVHDYMTATATALAEDFSSPYCYTQSDEISVVLPPAYDGFGRSLEKLVWVGATVDDVVDYLSWFRCSAVSGAS